MRAAIIWNVLRASETLTGYPKVDGLTSQYSEHAKEILPNVRSAWTR